MKPYMLISINKTNEKQPDGLSEKPAPKIYLSQKLQEGTSQKQDGRSQKPAACAERLNNKTAES